MASARCLRQRLVVVGLARSTEEGGIAGIRPPVVAMLTFEVKEQAFVTYVDAPRPRCGAA